MPSDKAGNAGEFTVGKIIHKEHQDLYSVLTCLRLMAKKGKETNAEPINTAVLHQAFNYMETFLNVFHHPKEDTYLFPVMRERCPEIGSVLDELEDQHRQLPQFLSQMQETLARYENNPEAEQQNLCDAIEACCTREIGHMKLEEAKVLAQARDSLSAEDWSTIDAAFAENRDPVFGDEGNVAYDALFRELVDVMPEPYGHGKPL